MSGTGGRLGLALSGGGFRASLFHVGVLRRLAELGLLQHVKVISSVSGGSITAAQYMLRLHGAVMERRKQSPPAPLRTADYVRIAEAVEEDFRQGLRGNLRSRLLLNPVDNLINLLGGTSLGRRMARLYVQFLFRRTLPPDAGSKVPALRDLVVPLEKDEIDPGFPDLVLNATSLNSGGCFRLTAMEIGDPDLGYIRTDEEELVLWYKRALHRASRDPGSSPEPAPASLPVRDRERIARSLPTHLAWWRFFTRRAEHTDGPGSRSEYEDAVRQTPPEVRGVCDFLANNPFLGDRLAAAGPGALRRAKITAWYLRNQNYRERAKGAGQSTPDELEREFRGALEDLDANLAEAIRSLDVASLADLVLDLYYLRSAESLAWGFRKALKKLTLADAVAMSANFPPVFGPLRVKNLYSHHLVDAVALTDGGVHDNQGIDTLMQDRCTGIVASDASGSPKTIPDQSGVRSELLGRIGSILGNRLRVLQVAALRERRRVTKGIDEVPPTAGAGDDPTSGLGELRERYGLRYLSFFHLLTNPRDARPGEPTPPEPHPDPVGVAHLRTDLDVFSEVEADGLIHQGYQLADRFVRDPRFVPPEILEPQAPPPDSGVPLPTSGPDLKRARRILGAGSDRFGRLFVLFPWLRQIGAALLVLAAIAAAVRSQISLADLLGSVGEGLRWVAAAFPLQATVLDAPYSGAVALTLAVLIAALWPGRGRRITAAVARRTSDRPERQARIELAARALNLWRRNIWWIVALLFAVRWGKGWWVVATAPLWLSVGGSVFSVILLIAGAVTARASRRSRSIATS